MLKHTYISLFKRRAKAHAKACNLSLSAAQGKLAVEAGFADLHELTTVGKRNPRDGRLLTAAFGTSDLTDLIYDDVAYVDLAWRVDEAMADSIAETNAFGFEVDDVQVTSSSYDDTTGQVWLDLAIHYAGEQHPDKAYHGASFDLVARVCLIYSQDGWVLSDYDGFEIIGSQNERERFREDDIESWQSP